MLNNSVNQLLTNIARNESKLNTTCEGEENFELRDTDSTIAVMYIRIYTFPDLAPRALLNSELEGGQVPKLARKMRIK
jgi:hypothetical protein